MVEPFSSIYTKDYRPQTMVSNVLSPLEPCIFYTPLENVLPQYTEYKYDQEHDDALIKELYERRLKSTYQLSYCSPVEKIMAEVDPDNPEEDQFLVYFKNYFKDRTSQVPKPLDSARRINNYSRPDYFYTGRTTYQEHISKDGYACFKRYYENGKSRIYGKKQRDKHAQMEEELRLKREEAEKIYIKGIAYKNKEVQTESSEKHKPPIKDRICGICCEKFGPFSCPPLKRYQLEQSDKTIRKNQ